MLDHAEQKALVLRAAEQLEQLADERLRVVHVEVSTLRAMADDWKRRAELIQRPPEFLEGGTFGG